MTKQGCESLQKNETPEVDFAKYDSAVNAMREELFRQMTAAYKAALSSAFGALVGGPGFIRPTQQDGVGAAGTVSPNSCLSGGSAPASPQPKRFAPLPTPPAPAGAPR